MRSMLLAVVVAAAAPAADVSYDNMPMSNGKKPNTHQHSLLAADGSTAEEASHMAEFGRHVAAAREVATVATGKGVGATVMGSLTTVKERQDELRKILPAFEKQERKFFRVGGSAYGLRLVAFHVIVDAVQSEYNLTLVQHSEQSHPWLNFIFKDSEQMLGQAHSINMAIALLRKAGADYWLKWEDSWMPVQPFLALGSALVGAYQPELARVGEPTLKAVADPAPGKPIVDVVFAGIHFDSVRQRDKHAGVLPRFELETESSQASPQQWRGEALCCTDGSPASRKRGETLCYHAEERADWLVDNKGLSQDEARLQVMSEFPDAFSAKDGFEFHRLHADGNVTDKHDKIARRCESLRLRSYEMADRGQNIEDYWPNFSLRPGLTLARNVIAVGDMDTDPLLWPWFFETKFACSYFLEHPDTVASFAIPHDDKLLERVSSAEDKAYVHTYTSRSGTTGEACDWWCNSQGAEESMCIEEDCAGCDQCKDRRATAWCGLSALQTPSAKADGKKCGMVWFTHIPKTGGTSVREYLEKGAKLNDWEFHDSLFLQYVGHPNLPIFMWDSSDRWSEIETALRAEAPRVIVHHHDGMPGLGNERLRVFLNQTRHSLEAKGCSLTLATMLRSPVARFVSDVNFHGLSFGDNETRAYAEQLQDMQLRYLLLNSHHYTAEDATLPMPEAEKRCNPIKVALRKASGLPSFSQCRVPPLQEERARAALDLYDLVGNSAEVGDFTDALSDAAGWPRRKVGHARDSVVRRPVHGSTKAWVAQQNVKDRNMYDHYVRRSRCNRTRTVAAAWKALEDERTLPKSVIFWKLKKVSGSTICNLLLDWADYKGKHFSYLHSDVQNNSVALAADVVCNHHTADRTGWPYLHLRADVQKTDPALQIVTVREPAEQLASFFYWNHIGDARWGMGPDVCTKRADHVDCTKPITAVPDLEAVQQFWNDKWIRQALSPWRPDSIESKELVPEVNTPEQWRRNTDNILKTLQGRDPPLVLLFENYQDSIRLLQHKLDWTFEDEEPLKDSYTHPSFEAWPEDSKSFVREQIKKVCRLNPIVARASLNPTLLVPSLH